MAKKPKNILKDIKQHLADVGYTKDIPMDKYYAAFLITTGYGRKKIHEWTDNFELAELIKIEDDKLNFIEG